MAACAAAAAPPRARPWQAAAARFAGGDLERPGVLEAALAARAPAKELIFLSVGDTRDHRRQYKDPALRTISVSAAESMRMDASVCPYQPAMHGAQLEAV